MTKEQAVSKAIWRFSVRLNESLTDGEAEGLKSDIADLGVAGVDKVVIARVYYLQGNLNPKDLKTLGEKLLADPVTEVWELQGSDPFEASRGQTPSGFTVEVAYRPGVRDPVEDSLKKGASDLGVAGLEAVRTAKAFTLIGPVDAVGLSRITDKLLVNATIQQVVTAENRQRLFSVPAAASFSIEQVPLLQASDTVLQRISLDLQLSLNLEEMQALQAYFKRQGREPALIELETLAQTWSEHCKHKTLRGTIVYTEEAGGKSRKRVIQNLLKETIMRVTEDLAKPWCVSVFADNSGVIKFDDQYHVCFKVETHNHPSALEPFGGASTGVGGVIRDILGTGLGAKPIASTDVFCFAPPDFPQDQVPQGVLQPRRVIKGVVAGVKDYGNKMGIPTVNGAVLFDDRFVGNPLVYCGNVGLLPAGMENKRIDPGMAVVVVGGRTGRDGVHGATFSSLTLATESEVVSSMAVQIGDPITEKRTADVLLIARDQGLFSAVTDCGAGGLSSAVGEMGELCGARVDLDRVPLKYAGLNPVEIWISESQERMVLAVPREKLAPLTALFQSHGVDATAIGEFTSTGKLELFFQKAKVGELEMDFLHHGLPVSPKAARWSAPAAKEPLFPATQDWADVILKLLGRWDTCSKEWIVRQYDHEVQGGSVIKPLGLGPSDAAVIRPRLDSLKGVVLANGINFRYGDLDPYAMAALAVDEVARQVVAVGGNLDHLAVLDNFCWGDPTRLEVLGSLVRAALGASDAARAYGTPFISGKDSLHNEYKMNDKTIQIPGTLLISGIGVMADSSRAVSMDAKKAGNRLYLAGITRDELGGSAYCALQGAEGGQVPQVDLTRGPALLRALSAAIAQGNVVSAHDCSEGGLAVAAAEMAFAGGLGLTLNLSAVKAEGISREDQLLFSESATRLLLEVPPEKAAAFEKAMAGHPAACVGIWAADGIFCVRDLKDREVVNLPVEKLREAWTLPFEGW